MRWRMMAFVVFLHCSTVIVCAGGPAFVAGSGYAPGVEGQALIWANSSVQYFTDRGDLSPILPGAQADTFVATAFGAWTGVSGVALVASQAGHLAEDVTGNNIIAANGTITGPLDIASSATSTPVGIVYDYDGTVTDALLGQGAGGLSDCFTNAVYGGPDNFSASGNIVHALVVINGNCAATTAQLPDVQYRLVRVLGRILGLGWSQANVNVLTQNPPATSDDFAGFPLMHFSDPISCVPISACYPDAAVPKMDDMDALARLYPASGNPQPDGRIYGSVYFTDASGNAGQPMQGVNVVARLMDESGEPSRRYVGSSVSGFAFHGNAGNIVDGYLEANGLRYDRWGSEDPSLEGLFDLGQLTIPAGQSTAQYQLSVEALDPNWSQGVEPYAPTQVTPSGSFAPVVVTIQSGSNVEQDILMLQSEVAQAHPGSGTSYATPGALPLGGGWGSWISGYGSTDFFEFTVQANRTASVSVIAVDETGQPTESKLQPVIGMWQLSDESGNPAPASTASAFNSETFGMSRLDAQFSVSGAFRVGVADYRGDGRPDYFYQARLLYSDTVTPARLSLLGGVATLKGTGFNPSQQVSVAGNGGSVLGASASQIEVMVPPASQDGRATIEVTDPASGAFSQMIGAVTYGAAATDFLLLLQGAEPSAPIGSQAANAIRVRAVAADGVTPVSGATIAWSATNGLQFSVCGAAGSCSVLSDEAGESSSWVTPSATGPSTITIALAPASYSSPQSQQATVLGTSSALDLVALTPTHWVGQGASVAIPLTVEALDAGVPMANVNVIFTVTNGAAVLSATSATTNGSGLATVSAQLTNQNASVQVSVCAAPSLAPCSRQPFTLFSTPPSFWTLETVSGSSQFVLTGQSFQPLVMRVTDGSLAANPVMGVNVNFNTTLARVSAGGISAGSISAGSISAGSISAGSGGLAGGDALVGSDAVPVLLGSFQAQVVSAQDGTASLEPSTGNVGPCEVLIAVGAGSSTAQFQLESLAAIVRSAPSIPAKAQTAPGDLGFAANVGSMKDSLMAEPQNSFEVLFAIPPSNPLDDWAGGQSVCSDVGGDACGLASVPHGDADVASPVADATATPPAVPTERDKDKDKDGGTAENHTCKDEACLVSTQ